MIRNNRGALTLDFIFAIVLVTGMSGILMAFSLTLVIVEASQYMAFATSRVYFGGHISEGHQAQLAEAKFNQLKNIKVFKGLLSRGWFTLSKVANHDFRAEYPDEKFKSTFVGARLIFEAKMLAFNIPFFGSTAADGESFKANVNSYLGREPSFQECMKFVGDRFKNVIQLPGAQYGSIAQPQAYVPHTDNGC